MPIKKYAKDACACRPVFTARIRIDRVPPAVQAKSIGRHQRFRMSHPTWLLGAGHFWLPVAIGCNDGGMLEDVGLWKMDRTN
jgi:hypothetical protein